MSVGKAWWVGPVVVLALVAVAFAPVLDNAFVAIDDPLYITKNPVLAGGVSMAALAWGLTTFYGGNWHPLTWYSHALDISLFGLQPAGHHAVNLLLHAANGLLLLLLVLRLTGRRSPAVVTVLLFALHPLRVESVAWAAERKDLLCALFFLFTLHAYVCFVKRRTAATYAATAGLLAMALAAKPMAVTLPLVLLLLDWWPLGRLTSGRPARIAPLLLEKAPLLVLAGAASAVTLVAQRSVDWVRSAGSYPWGIRLQNAVVSYEAYLRKTLWPTDLAMPYTHSQASLPVPVLVGAVLLLLALTCGAALLARRMPWWMIGWLWFAGMLVPVIGLVQVGDQALADRYTYLPSVGLAWAAAESLAAAGRWRRIALAGGCAAALLLLPLTRQQSGVWRSDVSLFEHAVRLEGDNWLAMRNLGSALLSAKRYDEAAATLERMIAGGQYRAEVFNNLGAVRLAQGRPQEAVVQFETAVRIDQTFALAWRNLGEAHERLGNREQASRAFALSLRFSGKPMAGRVSPHAAPR